MAQTPNANQSILLILYGHFFAFALNGIYFLSFIVNFHMKLWSFNINISWWSLCLKEALLTIDILLPHTQFS